MILRRASPFVLALALLPGIAAAGQIVQFEDGRLMPVERAERGAEMTTLTLEGGGQIAVPTARIVSYSPLSEPAPAPDSLDAAWREAAGSYADLIGQEAETHRVDPALLTAMAQVESAFDPRAVSPKGAMGLLQLMPATAARFGVDDAFDVAENVDGGARYMGWLLERFSGRMDLALAGYNAGEHRVDEYDGIPPFRETRNYVTKVLDGMERLSGPAAWVQNVSSR